MKVLDVTKFYSPTGGGVKTYLTEKARWASTQKDFDHVVVVPGPQDSKERWYGSSVYVVEGPAVPGSAGYHFLFSRKRFREIVQTENPDIIEVGSPFFVPWVARYAAKGTTTRVVGFFHSNVRRVYVDHGLAKMPSTIRAMAGRLVDRYLARAHRGFDLMVATSEVAAAGALATGIPCTIVPLGVDTEMFSDEKKDPSWKTEVGAKKGQRVGLYVGRFSREKGLDTIIEALPKLASQLDVRLVVLGDGPMYSQLAEQAQRLPDNLAVLPYEPDLANLARAYAGADFVIAPCPYETFGLAALEAMACGTPVVGANAGGIGDLLAEAPACHVFEPGDAGSLTEAVSAILNELSATRREKLSNFTRENFSWNKTFEKLRDVYANLLSGAA